MAVRSACARARATRGSSGRGARGARGGIRSRLGRRAGPAQGTRAPRLARASGALDLCPDWDHALDQASTDRRGDGAAQAEFDAALRRAGRLWHIVHVMSLNPTVLKASIEQYLAIMYGPSPLSRVQRELLATVVSAELDCFY